MQTRIDLDLAIVRDFHRREVERTARERRFDSTSRASIRRFVGHRVIAFGQRIAAEPSLELARTR